MLSSSALLSKGSLPNAVPLQQVLHSRCHLKETCIARTKRKAHNVLDLRERVPRCETGRVSASSSPLSSTSSSSSSDSPHACETIAASQLSPAVSVVTVPSSIVTKSSHDTSPNNMSSATVSTSSMKPQRAKHFTIVDGDTLHHANHNHPMASRTSTRLLSSDAVFAVCLFQQEHAAPSASCSAT